MLIWVLWVSCTLKIRLENTVLRFVCDIILFNFSVLREWYIIRKERASACNKNAYICKTQMLEKVLIYSAFHFLWQCKGCSIAQNIGYFSFFIINECLFETSEEFVIILYCALYGLGLVASAFFFSIFILVRTFFPLLFLLLLPLLYLL